MACEKMRNFQPHIYKRAGTKIMIFGANETPKMSRGWEMYRGSPKLPFPNRLRSLGRVVDNKFVAYLACQEHSSTDYANFPSQVVQHNI